MTEIIRLNPAWGVVYEDGSPSPYVVMRLNIEMPKSYSAGTFNHDAYKHNPVSVAKVYRRYPSVPDLLDEMRDRFGKIDPEAWRAVLALRPRAGSDTAGDDGGFQVPDGPVRIGIPHWL
ncbi:hypothetical protein [Chelativorans sp. AA-79]|uniref:hypothetical protein n=1 Tax=Chelativorans sp. AA-79 TaxID=3028735 RepID=UPI0023F9DEE1|nr:hypothetical protein [Chelativorans sp. AA-79]WEX07292.1 hypothetical protein PVE73_14240 [Chelativorans sp. AA-79]